jgi:hypothetical protein
MEQRKETHERLVVKSGSKDRSSQSPSFVNPKTEGRGVPCRWPYFSDRYFECRNEGWFGRDTDFFGISGFEEKLHRFAQILFSFFDSLSLAGNVQFRTHCHVPLAFLFNDGRKRISHAESIPQLKEVFISVDPGEQPAFLGAVYASEFESLNLKIYPSLSLSAPNRHVLLDEGIPNGCKNELLPFYQLVSKAHLEKKYLS